jgi:hypothetical protein
MAAKWLKKLLEGLKQVAPNIVGGAVGIAAGPLLGGVVGPVVANLMRKVTGQPAEDEDYEAMAATIMGSPELQLEIEKLAIERERIELEKLEAENDLERSKWEAETARMETVNATMRAEAGADDKWQRRWRPYWGFVSATAWGLIALSYSILVACIAFSVKGVEAAALTTVGSSLADMTVFLGVAAAILGVSAWKRGDEKIARIKARTKDTVPK